MQKCSENYNEGVVKKVRNNSDTNDDPQTSPLLKIPVSSLYPSPILHNNNYYDSYSDSNDNSDSEDKNYGTEKNIT